MTYPHPRRAGFARGLRVLPALLPLLLLSGAAQAQLPLARLHTVFPPGAPSGSTLDVTVTGADLDEPTGLIFSDPRLVATPKPGAPNTFSVAVPPELVPGLYEVRFAGRFGTSNPRIFAVGTEPEFTLNPTNTAPGSATDLPLDTVVHGRTPANNVLWFALHARAGQRLIAHLDAREIDSRLLPDLTLIDPQGRSTVLARRGAGSDFTAAADGRHLLRLHDLTYRGGDEFFFRLAVRTTPHVDFALPHVLRRDLDTPQRITLFGRLLPGGTPSPLQGLDGRPLDQLDVEIPAHALLTDPVEVLRKPSAAPLAIDNAAWRWKSPTGMANPILLARTAQAVFVTALPPSSLLVTSVPPCDVVGLFPRRGELSGALFAAKKGDAYWVEIFADRLGPNTDPAVVVQRILRDARGTESYADVLDLADTDVPAGGREFEASHRDAAARFQAPEDGTYRVLVRDLFRGSPDAPRLPYRLQIRRETPGYTLAAFPQPPPRRDDNDRLIHLWTTALRRHETLPVRVVAFRQDGFNGDIEIEARNLPPGLAALPARIPAGQNAATLLLTASSNAPPAAASLSLVGRSAVAGSDLVRTAVVATVRWPVPNWDQERGDSRLSSSLVVSVVGVEPAPVEVAVTQTNRLQVVAGGKLSVPLAVHRRFEYPAAFNLKPSGHPELDKAKELAIPEKATNVTWELNLAETKLPEGEHLVCLQGFITGKYRNNPQAAEAADRDAQAAAKAATDAAERVRKSTARLAELDKELPALETRLKEAQAKSVTGTDPALQQAVTLSEAALAKARESRESALAEKKQDESRAAAAEKAKTETAASAKAATERAAPRDVPVRVYSTPFLVRVTPAPKAS